MFVTDLKGAVTTAGCASYGYDAEATVEEGIGNVKYVHANLWEDELTFTVSSTSYFDYMTGDKRKEPLVMFDEEYIGLDEAVDSKYYKVMQTLDQMITLMSEGC